MIKFILGMFVGSALTFLYLILMAAASDKNDHDR